MTQYQVAHVDGSWRVYTTENGIDRQYLGPRCSTPREAAAWADFCAANPPTPRGSAEVNASFPPLASEEPRPTLSRPDVGVVAATSHRASSTG